MRMRTLLFWLVSVSSVVTIPSLTRGPLGKKEELLLSS